MWLPLLLAAQLYGPQQLPPVADADDPLVDAAGVVAGLIVDLAYATPDNIVGRALYPAGSKCLLRGSVAQRLAMAADALRKRGFRLVARDCTRSLAAQKALFAAHPGRAFSRDFLLERIWDQDFEGFDRAIDTHVRRLRRKLGPLGDSISTVWGVGYRFVPPGGR